MSEKFPEELLSKRLGQQFFCHNGIFRENAELENSICPESTQKKCWPCTLGSIFSVGKGSFWTYAELETAYVQKVPRRNAGHVFRAAFLLWVKAASGHMRNWKQHMSRRCPEEMLACTLGSISSVGKGSFWTYAELE